MDPIQAEFFTDQIISVMLERITRVRRQVWKLPSIPQFDGVTEGSLV